MNEKTLIPKKGSYYIFKITNKWEDFCRDFQIFKDGKPRKCILSDACNYDHERQNIKFEGMASDWNYSKKLNESYHFELVANIVQEEMEV